VFTRELKELIYEEDVKEYEKHFSRENILRAFHKNQIQINYEYREKVSEGNYEWFFKSLTLFMDKQSRHIKGMGYVKNIHQQKQKTLQEQHMRDYNSVTKLYNIRALTKQINEHVFSSINEEKCFILVRIIEKKSKKLNSYYEVKQHIFQNIAAEIKKVFQEEDIFGHGRSNDFIILQTKVVSKQSTIFNVNELCQSISIFLNPWADVRFCIGLCYYPSEARIFERLYEQAENVLTLAKRHKGMRKNYSYIKIKGPSFIKRIKECMKEF